MGLEYLLYPHSARVVKSSQPGIRMCACRRARAHGTWLLMGCPSGTRSRIRAHRRKVRRHPLLQAIHLLGDAQGQERLGCLAGVDRTPQGYSGLLVAHERRPIRGADGSSRCLGPSCGLARADGSARTGPPEPGRTSQLRRPSCPPTPLHRRQPRVSGKRVSRRPPGETAARPRAVPAEARSVHPKREGRTPTKLPPW